MGQPGSVRSCQAGKRLAAALGQHWSCIWGETLPPLFLGLSGDGGPGPRFTLGVCVPCTFAKYLWVMLGNCPSSPLSCGASRWQMWPLAVHRLCFPWGEAKKGCQSSYRNLSVKVVRSPTEAPPPACRQDLTAYKALPPPSLSPSTPLVGTVPGESRVMRRIFWKKPLLRYNSSTNYTACPFKVYKSRFLDYSQCYVSITTVYSRARSSPQKGPHTLDLHPSHSSFCKAHGNQHLPSVSMDLPALDISHKWTHTLCGFL